jgi:hypothetical protein
MSRIIQAINSMIINRDQITETSEYKSEYFFKFLNYVWSIKSISSDSIFDMFHNQIRSSTEDYILTYYPGYTSVSSALNDVIQNKTIKVVRYSDDTFKSQEATESFRDLYKTITEKVYNLDNVLDDIISLSDKENR